MGNLVAVFPAKNLGYHYTKKTPCSQQPEQRIKAQFGETRMKQNL
jgi:hypothetical protein